MATERIFDHADDKNVAAIVIYGKETADGKAYIDKACTKQFTNAELKNAFIKRAVICVGEKYFVPISYACASKVGSVNYVTTTGSSSDIKTVLTNLAAVADA
jgi:hypothetical protein|nr:MAG TPA_asm: hypothetical protein [Caudoviricetes sp.]